MDLQSLSAHVRRCFLTLLPILVLGMMPLACTSPGEDPIEPTTPTDPAVPSGPSVDKPEPGTSEPGEIAFTYADIPFTGSVPAEQEIQYTDPEGHTVPVTGYPGLVVVCFDATVRAQEVWEIVEAAGGKVVAQIPMRDFYLVKVKEGEEQAFINAMRKKSGCLSAFPETAVRMEAAYYFDGDEHGKDVAYQMGLGASGLKTVLVDRADYAVTDGNVTRYRVVEAITGALDKQDCEVVNISAGPNYGTAKDRADYEKAQEGSPEKAELGKKLRYGYKEDLDAAYVESRVTWFNTVGRMILKKGVSAAPVVVSAGNDGMHDLEKIIGKMDPECRELLGSRLVIVSAQQNEHLADYQKDYSNRVSTKVKGVMTVNIDGVTSHDGKHYLMGTSFAAPTLVRYLYQIVEASKEGGNPMSYQAAIELLTKHWMEGSQTAWTDQAIGDLVALLRSGATSLEAQSRYGEYYVLPEQRGYGTAFTHVKNQYEDYNYYKLEITSSVPIDTPRLNPSDSKVVFEKLSESHSGGKYTYEYSIRRENEVPFTVLQVGFEKGANEIRPSGPVSSRQAAIVVPLKTPDGSIVEKEVATLHIVGIPALRIKKCEVKDGETFYGMVLGYDLTIDYEIVYPDDLTRSFCGVPMIYWESPTTFFVGSSYNKNGLFSLGDATSGSIQRYFSLTASSAGPEASSFKADIDLILNMAEDPSYGSGVIIGAETVVSLDSKQ